MGKHHITAESSALRSQLVILAAAFFCGLSNVLGKKAAALVSFATIYLVVTLTSWTLLFVISVLTGEIQQCRSIRRRDMLWILVYALCGFAVPLYFLLVAYGYSRAAEIGFLPKADSASARLFGYAVLRERPEPSHLSSVIVMLTGAFLLLTGFSSWHLEAAGGLALITALLWGWSHGMAKLLLRRGFSPLLPAVLKRGTSIPFLLPILLTGAASASSVFEPGIRAVILLILFSILRPVVAHPLFNHGLRTTQTWLGAGLVLTDSMSSAIFASLLLGERLSAVEGVGAVCILAGVVLVTGVFPRITHSERH